MDKQLEQEYQERLRGTSEDASPDFTMSFENELQPATAEDPWGPVHREQTGFVTITITDNRWRKVLFHEKVWWEDYKQFFHKVAG